MQVHAKAGKNAYILQNSALKVSKAKKKQQKKKAPKLTLRGFHPC